MRKKYSKEEFAKIVKESYSFAEVKRKIGLKSTGSNDTVKKYIEKYNLDTSHFTGQNWNKGKSLSEETCLVAVSEILNENTNYKSHYLKERLFKSGLKQQKCEVCGLETTWNDKPITLELHHINGNHYDNRLENLQILCPNCHSQTENYKRRNKNKSKETPTPLSSKHKREERICQYCGKSFWPSSKSQKYCSVECYEQSKARFKKKNRSKEITEEQIKEVWDNFNTLTDMAKYFEVSRPHLATILKEYDLFEQFRSKYTFHAREILQCDLNGNIIKEWPSVTDAVITFNDNGIKDCLANKRRSCEGYIWKYKK